MPFNSFKKDLNSLPLKSVKKKKTCISAMNDFQGIRIIAMDSIIMTLKKIHVLIFVLFITASSTAQNQSQVDTALSFTMVKLGGGFQYPGGDLKERFGSNTNLELSFSYKHKSNFLIGVQGNFMFGNNVKEDTILNALLTSSGNVIDNGGELGSIFLDERGFAVFGTIGKIFPLFGPNPNSGILLSAGVGFLQHKIRIEYRDSKIPALENGYNEGYDRLSNGIAITGFLGYNYFADQRLINFYIGIDFMQAWTVNRRGFNYDSGKPDTKQRIDRLTGLKFGWILPLYKGKPEEFYLY